MKVYISALVLLFLTLGCSEREQQSEPVLSQSEKEARWRCISLYFSTPMVVSMELKYGVSQKVVTDCMDLIRQQHTSQLNGLHFDDLDQDRVQHYHDEYLLKAQHIAESNNVSASIVGSILLELSSRDINDI
jgi:hypothetical protein